MSGKSRFNVLCKDVPWDRTRELQNPRREEQDGMSTGLGTAVAGTRFCEPMYPCQCGPFSTLASSWLEPPRLALLSLHLRFRSPSEPGGVAHINTQLRRLQVQLLSRTGFCFVLFSSFLKKKKKKATSWFLPACQWVRVLGDARLRWLCVWLISALHQRGYKEEERTKRGRDSLKWAWF